jgi:beta-glucosidase
MVLLKNDGASLPLTGVTNIVLLGRAADVDNIGDEGSSAVRPTDVVTALEGMSARATVTHLVSIEVADEAAVSAADAVIVVTGMLAEDEGENGISAGDRARSRSTRRIAVGACGAGA